MLLDALSEIVSGLEPLLASNTELVVHDLRKPEASVVAIANGHISSRRVGDAIVAGPRQDEALKALVKNVVDPAAPFISASDIYETQTRVRSSVRSISVLLRDSDGRAFGGVCMNVDHSDLIELQRIAGDLIKTARVLPEPEQNTLESAIREIVENSVKEIDRPLHALTKDDRKSIIKSMRDKGLFLARSGVDIAASRLNISRFTVYNYINEIDAEAE